MNHLPHSDYFRDRDSEEELCRDFPADEIFIYGLHAMQMHFWSNNIAVEIPVVRVMNTAHYIAAYMFATTCSGDQMEYDVLAYDSLSRDKQLTRVAMIVLAAMLQRTEGFRARNCRNLILDNRDPDFEEGVTLYDRFLRSAEKHFAEEDFLIDIPALVQRNQQLEYENRQLVTENKELKIKYLNMEEKYQQINIGTQNNNCTQIGNQYNITFVTSPTDIPHYAEEPSASPQIELFKYIHIAVIDEKEREQIHKMVCNIVRLPKMKQICDELYLLIKKEKILSTIKPEAMLAELRRIGMPSADTPGFSDQNFYSSYRA